ncbi:Hypothetical protein SCLAV_0125 [Streptomyces clavuligerus]|uniref:Uncharacterized protein n=1 Tax=Streptomyces clavuligerus TaxID=1901 RepID=B5H0T7_STRCL|nr:hypothetical protein SSCG_05136 [Streptomyces clavuligerus]EFG05201.1 Hypothetical protein SCLAV_0125 [Streptomyces clavuligerus]
MPRPRGADQQYTAGRTSGVPGARPWLSLGDGRKPSPVARPGANRPRLAGNR